MTTQHAAPDRNATHIVVASPLRSSTSHSARIAPKHAGSSSTAMMSLHHFGMTHLNHGCRATKIEKPRTHSYQYSLPVPRVVFPFAATE